MVDLNAHEAGNGGQKPREAYSLPSLLYSECCETEQCDGNREEHLTDIFCCDLVSARMSSCGNGVHRFSKHLETLFKMPFRIHGIARYLLVSFATNWLIYGQSVPVHAGCLCREVPARSRYEFRPGVC